MNAQLREGELLAPTGTAIAEYSATEQGLALLREQLAGATFDCTTTEGDKQARESRRMLVSLRVELEAKRKELKAPLLDRGRLLDDEAKRITGEIVAMETPIDAQIKAEEQRREDARRERERVAAEKAAAVTAQIDRIRSLPITYVAATAEVLIEAINDAEAMTFPDFDVGDVQRVEEAREAALAGLHRALSARIDADAERARLDAEREELKRLRAEQEEAQRVANEKAAAERAEADRLAEDERIKADAIAAHERHEAAEAQRVEQERIAAEQAEERKRLDDQRAELERQQAEQRERETAERLAREQEEIDRCSLRHAAEDARILLLGLAPNHITTRKLCAALDREPTE